MLSLLAISGPDGFSAPAPEDKGPSSNPVTTFHQFFQLSRQETLKGRTVQIKGVVLSFDPGWNNLYVHDGKDVLYLSPRGIRTKLEQGQMVTLSGPVAWVDGRPGLTNFAIETRGRGKVPESRSLKLSELGEEYGGWVETSGRVRNAEVSSGRLALVLVGNGRSCYAMVLGQPATNDYRRLLDCEVRLRAVNTSKTAGGQLESASLTVPGMHEIKVIEGPDAEAGRIPVVSVDSLMNRELGPWTNGMVHLSGVVVTYRSGEFLTLKDPTGIAQAQVLQSTPLQPGVRIDLWGYLRASSAGAVIRDAYFTTLRQQSVYRPTGSTPGNRVDRDETGQALGSVSEVLKLPKEVVSRGLPVRLRGIVTYADPEWRNGFFQDSTGAIYFDVPNNEIRAGQAVELRGETAEGGFAPEIVNCLVRIGGPTNFPAPAKVGLEDLLNGHLDATWVELQGVVRRVEEQSAHAVLTLMTRKGRFKVFLPMGETTGSTSELIDGVVSVQGACGMDLGGRGQLAGVRLHTPGRSFIRVVEAPPPDPFAVPATTTATIATFDPERLAGHRVKVSGTVTFKAAGQGFYVQDESGGIRVIGQQTGSVEPGERVEVVGFPAHQDFSPCLEEATFQSKGRAMLPEPSRVTAEGLLLDPSNDGRRVQIEARLVQTVPRSANPRLVVQDGPVIFTAHLAREAQARDIPALRAGTLLRLTGVASIQSGESHEPEAFRLLVASAPDIAVLQAPPWWTARQAMMAGGGVAAGLVAALAWIGLLRRQVRTQTRAIKNKHKELLEISRKAGMAEVATGVLHNVGNVLNSVNVTTALVSEGISKSKVGNVLQIAQLMRAQGANVGEYLANDPKGKQIPAYLEQLGEHLEAERTNLLTELISLTKNVGHIKDIIVMQQSYAKVTGISECVKASELIDDAVRMNANALARHDVKVVKDYDPNLPEVTVEKHKVLQILVNLIQNAKYACDESGRPDKRLTLRAFNGNGRLKIAVTDNGIGIPPENLTRIFGHGFTTRRHGHGFGLHSGALAAGELGGVLHAQSDGPGQGATFILELPLTNPTK